ncbi:P-loop containing nucleoside triphosphate hydrolase protein [Trichoderma compactum]
MTFLLSSLTRRLAIGAPLSFAIKPPVCIRSCQDRVALTPSLTTHQPRPPGIHNPSRSFTSSHGQSRQRTQKPSFTLSPEQQNIVSLCAEQNVVVSARPGSGKTAMAEAIAAHYPHLRIAFSVYSKILQLENARRLKKYRNANVFTIHKMARLLFGTVVHDDVKLLEQIKRAVSSNELPEGDFEPFDIIVLDEFQDCDDLLYWLIICFIRVNTRKRGGRPAHLVTLGDERQSIFRFRGADHRYLTLAPELLGPISAHSFVELPLSESFRLSNKTVQFINKTFLGGDSYMTSSKPGPKPIVFRYSPPDINALAKKLAALIKQYGAKNSAIIAPSVRRNRRLIKLVNILAKKYGIPIAQPIEYDSPVDKRILDGKLSISTIHGFKGRERDLVILLGIDSSFFRYLGRDLPDHTCPNEVFVALTRAAEQLVLVHDEKKKLMPFVSVDGLYETAEVINMTSEKTKIASPNAPGRALQFGLDLPPKVNVTDMARYVRGERLDAIIRRDLCIQELSASLPEKEHIRMRDVVCSNPEKGFYEAVGDINGIVVLAAFQHAVTGTTPLFVSNNQFAEEELLFYTDEQVSRLCRNACAYQARISGYLPRYLQMKNHGFDWINLKDLALAQNRLQSELGDSASNLRFEFDVERYLVVDKRETLLYGRADVITTPTISENSDVESVESIWEIKFVSKLSNEHIVQACTYAYLLATRSGQIPRIILYNVRDGKKLEITPRDGLDGLRRMIESVLRLKYTAERGMEDDEFTEMCTRTTRQVLDLDNPREKGRI